VIDLQSGTVALNGRALQLGSGDAIPELVGTHIAAGDVALGPASITFLASKV
jgi:hypothetical protein